MNLFRTLALAAVLVAAPFAAHAAPYSNDPENRVISIVNNSDFEVYRVFYGVPGRGYYTRDLLAEDTISTNDSHNVLVDDGSGRCVFNVKAETRSGGTFWEKQINVCSDSEFKLGN